MSFIDDLFSLDGRVAFVTGGSSGIGLAMAGALARAGAAVVLAARREHRLRDASNLLNAQGGRAEWVVADLATEDGINECVRAGAVHFGQPDILINAAGVNLRPPMKELTPEDWATTMRLNLDAPFLLGQQLAPVMVARGFGRIINIASQQAIRAFGNSGAYGVSKAGISALTRSQAEAWSRHGVTANAIAPGFVRTPLTQAVFDDRSRLNAMAARTMIGRNGELADFAGIAVFLASRSSDFITGQTLFVDGGFSVT